MLKFIEQIGADETDSDSRKLRKAGLLKMTVVFAVMTPVWSILSYTAGLGVVSLVPMLSLAAFAIGVISLSVSKNEKYLLHILLVTSFICPVAMQWLTGGILKGGIVIFWVFFTPLIALIFRQIKWAHFYMALAVVSMLVMGFFNNYFEKWGTYIDRDQKLWLHILLLVMGVTAIYAAMQYFVKTIDTNRKVIDAETSRSKDLLLNVLPAHVAEELKERGTTSPSQHEGVTIIFTDFKDFTQFSELFTPQELIDELAMCFEAFDDIVLRHRLEKIKTMGDAYMCVGGISKDTESPAFVAERSVLAAMEMAEFIRKVKMEKLRDGKAYWDVRVGVHTGDVVAGVVGKSKFVYDIWGDAVNIANRLQTCSEEGRVNISDTTYKLVRDYFLCTPRGHVPVKNKGELSMYFVDGKVNLG